MSRIDQPMRGTMFAFALEPIRLFNATYNATKGSEQVAKPISTRDCDDMLSLDSKKKRVRTPI